MGALFVVKSAVDLFVLGEDAGDHVGGETAVDLVADHGDGGETAGTDATEGVQGELAVGGALALTVCYRHLHPSILLPLRHLMIQHVH